jgi:methionyl-tRNA formyltransferase
MQPGAGGLDDLERQLRVLEARKHPARKFSNVKERIGAVTAIGGRGLLVSAQGGQSEVLTLWLEDGKKLGAAEFCGPVGTHGRNVSRRVRRTHARG